MKLMFIQKFQVPLREFEDLAERRDDAPTAVVALLD